MKPDPRIEERAREIHQASCSYLGWGGEDACPASRLENGRGYTDLEYAQAEREAQRP